MGHYGHCGLGGAKVTVRVIYDGPLVAPIAKDAEVAMLEVRVDDLPPVRVPLRAATSVAQASPFQRLLNGLRGWFA